MPKNSMSINLEEYWWDYVDAYMKEKGVKSRSLAMEWIMVEFKSMKDMLAFKEGKVPTSPTPTNFTKNNPPTPKKEKPQVPPPPQLESGEVDKQALKSSLIGSITGMMPE